MFRMNLRTWLEQNDVSVGAFAERIGRHRTTVQRLARGEVLPNHATARAIFAATAGAVTPNDFIGITADTAAA